MESQLQAEQISAHFGKAAQTYEQSARLQREVAFDALRFLPQQQQGTLLDLGCGPGWFHHNLSSFCNELHRFGFKCSHVGTGETPSASPGA